MAGRSISNDRRSARIATVEQHIRLENEHDLEGILHTFGDSARYDDEPWDEHYEGLTASGGFTNGSWKLCLIWKLTSGTGT